MATDKTRITVPGRAHIYLSVVGTTAPINSTAALDPGFVEVGLTTPDSLTFAGNPTFGTVTSHQSDYVTRVFQQSDEARVTVDLQEFSGDNLLNVFGGGEITTLTTGQYKFVPPTVGGRTNVACIAEAIDGAKHYRFVIPICFQDAGVTMKLAKTSEVTLPLNLLVLGSDDVDPWYLLTNDPSFA